MRDLKGKKRKFKRKNAGEKKRVKDTWRTPHGLDSNQGRKQKAAGRHPGIGYKKNEKDRGMHPRGMGEVLVRNAKDLEAIDGNRVLVRFSSKLGGRKRMSLVKLADSKGLMILNR